MQGTQPAIGAR